MSNTTITYGGGVRRVYAIDRAEKRALILRTRGGQQQVVAVPVAGGTPIIVAQFPLAARTPEAALSGNGRKVVVSSEASGTRLYDLTGGTASEQAVLGDHVLDRFNARSISDTASAVVGYDINGGSGLTVLRPGKPPVHVDTDTTNAALDPSGTVLAYVDSREVLVLRKLSDGSERRWRLERGGSYDVLWTASAGSKIVVTGSPDPDARFARVFSPATGTWAPFGERFSRWIYGEDGRTLISANGRLALTGQQGLPGAITLMNTSGAHIVGANEGLAANAYVWAGTDVSVCNQAANFSAVLVSPSFAPAPKKATLTASVDGTVIASGTLTNSVRYPPFPGVPDEPGWRISGQYVPADHGDLELAVTVVDGAGRVLTETWTEPVEYCPN